MRSERISHLTTSDGLRLLARTWRPEHPGSTTVVVVPGFTGSKDNDEVVAVARGLVDAGFRVLAYDARGHHGSAGLCTLGDDEQFDVAAAVAAAREVSERVVTVGASMGGIAVLRHASTDPDLDGVVTVSSPAQWKLPRTLKAGLAALLTRTRMGRSLAARHLGVRIDPAWNSPPEPSEVAGLIRAPMAVIHGAADRMIPLSEAHRLVQGAGGPTRLDIVSGMGHAFDALSVPAIVSAVRWVLDRPVTGLAPA